MTVKIFFFITSSMEKPSPSWHLMKALLEDTLNAGISVYAIEKHFNDAIMQPFPFEIMNHRNFTYSGIESKTIDKGDFVKRYLSGIWYSVKARKYYRLHDDYDMIFVQSSATSLFYVLIAKYFAKKRPVLYNSQDMFPGSAVANGSIKQKWIQKILYALQKIAYKKADLITAISEDMKDKLIEQGVEPKKIQVIVNWYDDQEVHEVAWKDNRFVKKYNLSDKKFYVQYAGTMGTNFNYKIILDVAALLKKEKDIEFQMIGEGVGKTQFEKDAKNRRLDNISFYPLQRQDMVSDVYSACSVCIIPLKKGVIGNSVPSKAALLMACGRVIVNSVDDGCDYGEMFEREKIGFTASTTDAKKIADDILFLYHNPEERIQYGIRAKEYGRREYSRAINTKKYIDIFRNLCGM